MDQTDPDTETASVMFLDVRGFTLLLDNYGESRASRMLDVLFENAKKIVEENEGTVDKLIGDGMMAVFEEKLSAENAITAAIKIRNVAVNNTKQEVDVDSININIGISTGEILNTDISGIESTFIGGSVNVASRLEGLCKEYDVGILIDEDTFNSIKPDTLSANCELGKVIVRNEEIPEDTKLRCIPDQNIRGIRTDMHVYHVCHTRELSDEYVDIFNKGVRNFNGGNYEEALSFFTEGYNKTDHYRDQRLLNRFTDMSLEKLNEGREIFRNPDEYEEHSYIQELQSLKLFNVIDRSVKKLSRDPEGFEFTPERILDVGCGTGKVTEALSREKYPEARIIGIDESNPAIKKARNIHNPEGFDIQYKRVGIENYQPKKLDFDLIFSNSAMHWVEEQDQAYENMRSMIDEDGILAIHQGKKGTYQELHEVVIEIIHDLKYNRFYEDLEPPLGLTYYETDEYRELLVDHGFEPVTIETGGTENPPDSIIKDFAEASLNAYRERLDSDAKREVFTEQFIDRAQEKLEPRDITVNRLYAVARPV